MLTTLDGSDDNKIQPQGLTIPVIVPHETYLTTYNDAIKISHERFPVVIQKITCVRQQSGKVTVDHLKDPMGPNSLSEVN